MKVTNSSAFKGAFAILMLIMFIVCGRARDTRTKNNTVRITLLSIMFTHDGKVLVNPDGTLPEQKICRNHEDRVCSVYAVTQGNH